MHTFMIVTHVYVDTKFTNEVYRKGLCFHYRLYLERASGSEPTGLYERF